MRHKAYSKETIRVQDKSFILSSKVMELYILLLKQSELDLAEKILASNMKTYEAIHDAHCEQNSLNRIHAISEALQHATDTRYWIKLVQMKNIVNSACDEVVESLNETISILTWLSLNDNDNKIKLVYQLN